MVRCQNCLSEKADHLSWHYYPEESRYSSLRVLCHKCNELKSEHPGYQKMEIGRNMEGEIRALDEIHDKDFKKEAQGFLKKAWISH